MKRENKTLKDNLEEMACRDTVSLSRNLSLSHIKISILILLLLQNLRALQVENQDLKSDLETQSAQYQKDLEEYYAKVQVMQTSQQQQVRYIQSIQL